MDPESSGISVKAGHWFLYIRDQRVSDRWNLQVWDQRISQEFWSTIGWWQKGNYISKWASCCCQVVLLLTFLISLFLGIGTNRKRLLVLTYHSSHSFIRYFSLIISAFIVHYNFLDIIIFLYVLPYSRLPGVRNVKKAGGALAVFTRSNASAGAATPPQLASLASVASFITTSLSPGSRLVSRASITIFCGSISSPQAWCKARPVGLSEYPQILSACHLPISMFIVTWIPTFPALRSKGNRYSCITLPLSVRRMTELLDTTSRIDMTALCAI